MEGRVRAFERRLGLDRQDRSTWVWVLPPASGVLVGLLFGIMPGIDIEAGWSTRLLFGLFGFIATIIVSIICMASFDRDPNQHADSDR